MPAPKKKPVKQKKAVSRHSATKKSAKTRKSPLPVAASKTLTRSVNAEEAENTTLDRIYIIDDSANNVTLAIKVGDKGQTSDMTIKLDENIIAENHTGDLAETILGNNKQLNGKKLTVVATIADTSRETNLTSLKIQLKGGMDPAEYNLLKNVADEGASVDYLCIIQFYKP